MENQKANLAAAVIAVMKAVEGIEKNTDVGSGTNAYKGVSDKDVKKIIGAAMAENGLCILPIGVKSTIRVDRWEEPGYNNVGTKTKQAVFTEVDTEYLLLHTSGESQVVTGYGHGADSQDKSAGKATTYALKNLLLYMFLVPTGKIDDTDDTHSKDIAPPPAQTNEPKFVSTTHDKPWLNENTEKFLEACEYVKSGKVSVERIKKDYNMSAIIESKLQQLAPKN